jgi:hypothetical protein
VENQVDLIKCAIKVKICQKFDEFEKIFDVKISILQSEIFLFVFYDFFDLIHQ